MKSGTETTHIFLERGGEDRRLLLEIDKVIKELGISSIRTLVGKYPLIYELKYKLQSEIDEQSLMLKLAASRE